MNVWNIPFDVLERVVCADRVAQEDMDSLICSEPQNIQIDMVADSEGEYVPVGITYLFDVGL